MIVGTAGHIDHGKTSLTRALTGVDTDRLKEEKARGISIDLGFAYLPAPDGATLGFVDVPGHEKFVHNMLAGATGIDFVLLVVAADDGVMPQTREHLAIVDLLGIRHGIVALTKSDLASPERRAQVETEIANTLTGTGLAGVDILPVSVVTGEGRVPPGRVAEFVDCLSEGFDEVADWKVRKKPIPGGAIRVETCSQKVTSVSADVFTDGSAQLYTLKYAALTPTGHQREVFDACLKAHPPRD